MVRGWWDPHPPFFVSVASKGVRFSITPLDATLVGRLAGAASKGVIGGMIPWELQNEAAASCGSGGRTAAADGKERSGRGCGLGYTRKNSTRVWIG
jgi:hypothetical protein